MTDKRIFWADFDAEWLRRKVRVFCAEHGYTQAQLAGKLEIVPSTISRMLQGKTMPSQKLLALLGYEWRITPIEAKKGDK